MKQIQSRKAWTSSYEEITAKRDDLEVLYEFYTAGDVSDQEVDKEYKEALKKLEDLELKKMMSSAEEQLSAMMEINPGAGGTESKDRASILMMTYIVW